MSNLTDHAKYELERAGWFDPDSFYGDMMGNAVLKMVELFAEEGHSGMSASIAIGLFKKVASFEPLTPLTGEDNEWVDHGEGLGRGRFQNKRCGHVFKDEDGTAYDSQGKVFVRPDGASYTSGESRVIVTFPYTPKTEYVEVEEKE